MGWWHAWRSHIMALLNMRRVAPCFPLVLPASSGIIRACLLGRIPELQVRHGAGLRQYRSTNHQGEVMKRMIVSAMLLAACAAQAQAAEFGTADLCKAAIAVEMGRDAKSMKTKTAGDTPEIFYVRDADGQKFSYRCKLDGDRIVWRTFLNDDGQWGRWRDGEYDAMVTYSVKGDTLHVESDQAYPKSFTKADFGG